MRNDLKNFIKRDWIKHWAGQWKLLNNSYLGYQYTKLLKKSLGVDLEYAVFISHQGYTVCYLDLRYYKKFGDFCANKLVTNQKQVNYWTGELTKRTDEILSLIKSLKKKPIIRPGDYEKFVAAFYAYGVPHRVVKIVVDSLSPVKFKQWLPKLSAARVYSEPVYAATEIFMEFIADQIAKNTGNKLKHILYITKDEMENYWQNHKLPSKIELVNRFNSSTIIYERGREKLLVGSESDELEKQIANKFSKAKVIKGFTAYPGKVCGKVRIIFDPRKAGNFKTGEILVTGMTRPEYVPLIKKSAGFITDAGGMLSHAAISAREFKKPCLVGTGVATKILKDGQSIELDATNGVIKKLK